MCRAIKPSATLLALVATAILLPSCGQPPSTPAAPPRATPTLNVGLRRSSYGLPAKNADDAWWIDRAKQFAAGFAGARPVIVQIVSSYQDDGSTQFGFAKPPAYSGPTTRMSFAQGKLDHDRALSAYDAAGVKAILQLESGDADLVHCLEVAHDALGHHPCVIGYGIDAEWYFTKQSPDKTGRPVSDAAAQAATEEVLSFNKDFTFFIKHFNPIHLPPKYRHSQLWFLSDSQDFATRDELLADFGRWAKACDGSATGFQFGYPKDRKWWSTLAQPPRDLGTLIRQRIPSCQYLFWVDFSADAVSF